MSENVKCAHGELLKLNSPKLIPNPKNPNKHPPEQIEWLAKIIDYQGQRSPIVISKRSGFITKGHGRLMAIQKLNWDKIAVDYQDYENEAQEYADIVADNAISEQSFLDKAMIELELEEMPELTMELMGLKEIHIDLIDKDYSDKNKEIDIDNFGNDLQHCCPKCGFEFNE